nr:odorant binding protein 5 [Pachyrhinus yasumatsui]
MGRGSNGKSVLVYFLISLLSLTAADQRQKIVDFHANCLDEHGVEEVALHEALDGRPPEEIEFYNHMFCVAKKSNVMSEDGVVNLDNFEVDMKDVIDEDNMENLVNILKKCLIQKEDIMSTVRDAVACFTKEDHRL